MLVPLNGHETMPNAAQPKIRDWVIDADTHITEPGDVWTARLPARFQDRAPRIRRSQEGVDSWSFGESRRAVPIGHTSVSVWHEPFPAAPRNMDECPPAACDAKAQLAYMDAIGIRAMALYPNIGGFGSESFLGLGDPELMVACVRAYNDGLLDWISPDPRRFIPILATPFWDVEAAAAEVRRGPRRPAPGHPAQAPLAERRRPLPRARPRRPVDGVRPERKPRGRRGGPRWS
jgi:predicted TIM-barrel fold metal-dependent hydrolase